MTPEQLRQRTKDFALRCLKLADALPSTSSGKAISMQLSRSGCSVGANDRGACRARSKKEFIAKLSIVHEEADESCYWLELVIEAKLLKTKVVEALLWKPTNSPQYSLVR